MCWTLGEDSRGVVSASSPGHELHQIVGTDKWQVMHVHQNQLDSHCALVQHPLLTLTCSAYQPQQPPEPAALNNTQRTSSALGVILHTVSSVYNSASRNSNRLQRLLSDQRYEGETTQRQNKDTCDCVDLCSSSTVQFH